MHDVVIHGGAARLTVDEIRRRVAAHLSGSRVDRAILFGSFARGQADVASDVDLVLIEATDLPFVERGLQHLPLFRWGG